VTIDGKPPRENPFATRFTRPGAIAFIFPPGITAESLVDRLESYAWRGQIIGPHGAGKTSLLHALCPELERRGRSNAWISLRDGQRTLPGGALPGMPIDRPCQVIVDGYEQLTWWTRWRFNRQCKKHGWGLLVTAHASVGLPTVFEVQPQLQVLQQIARQLAATSSWQIADSEIAELFDRTGRNIRESLFELYDAYQRQNPSRRT